jgi:5-methylcytosine-specific restriction endonuclease McrA
MSGGGVPKRGRFRLNGTAYDELKIKILERDGWKCQRCGRRDQLQVHHLVRRSQSGSDCEGNLIVLCSRCHRSLHLTSQADFGFDTTNRKE